MNPAVVVDASVAVKWLIEEEFTEGARALLQDARRARRPLLAPPHFPSEVANALYQRLRHREDSITFTDADEALAQFLLLPIELVGPANLYTGAFAFARAQGLKDLYDSLYVVLAQMLNVDLWTDDRVLLKALGPAAPWVRWIGEYPFPQAG